MCEGFPLKRRHSRQDLLDEKERLEGAKRSHVFTKMGDCRESMNTIADLNSITPSAEVMGPHLQEYSVTGEDLINMELSSRSNEETDLYMRTPISLGGNPRDSFRPQADRAETLGQSLGWRHTDFGQLQEFNGEVETDNTSFRRMYEDDFIGGPLGYIAPFETATQNDMLATAGFAGINEQQISYGFSMQY